MTCPPGWEGAEIEIEPLDGQVVPQQQDHHHPHDHPHDHDHRHDHPHEHDHPHGHRPHVAVVPRPAPDGSVVHSAVFPSLPMGGYRLVEPDSGTTAVVQVGDGHVTEVDWSTPPA